MPTISTAVPPASEPPKESTVEHDGDGGSKFFTGEGELKKLQALGVEGMPDPLPGKAPAKTDETAKAAEKTAVSGDDDLPEPIKKGSAKAADAFRAERKKAAEAARKAEDLETRWKSIEGELSQLRADKDAAAKRVEELTAAKAKPPEDYEALKKRLAELDPIAKRYELEHSEEFGGYYRKQIDAAVEDAKAAVPAEQHATLEHLLRLPDTKEKKEALGDLIAELPEVDRMLVVQRAADVTRVRREVDRQLKDIDKNYNLLQEKRQADAARQEVETKKWREQFYNAILGLVDKDDRWAVLRKSDKPERNELMSVQQANMQKIVNGEHDPVLFANTLLLAAKAAVMEKEYDSQAGRIAELEKQVQELSSAGPKIGRSGTEGAGKKRPLTFEETMAAAQAGELEGVE